MLAGLRETDLARTCARYEPPLRSELSSGDQIEQHGRALASLHALSPGYPPNQLLTRLVVRLDTGRGDRENPPV